MYDLALGRRRFRSAIRIREPRFNGLPRLEWQPGDEVNLYLHGSQKPKLTKIA
jgi:hypothetical protein